ncbi:glycosyltransferase [Nonlabens marinus]|uniref:Glycosyltransferase n=1 Tax=Nonlabens marinus S1-08 TaxID=1454201 RepID=W8VXY4_9FLAO|nr:glycosyltransferase [Nonlabens marinus]BAO56732.1 glycosyltransferase [Nonlabens marinus S1-08]
MKKSVLILSSIYPAEDVDKEFTPVVHYFVREWVKQEHNVIVIHNQAFYHEIFHLAANLFSKIIATFTGTNIPSKRLHKPKNFNLEDVRVFRIPIFKKIPRSRFSSFNIDQQILKISKLLESTNFKPDIILGHWLNPQLELIAKLKSIYPQAATCLTLHSNGGDILRLYPDNYAFLMTKIDKWGFRSRSLKVEFESCFGQIRNTFICPSGIPRDFINLEFEKSFEKKLRSFIFIGSLIKRKYPVILIEALMQVYPKIDFSLEYVGEGREAKKIDDFIKSRNLENNITRHGYVKRSLARRLLLDSHCFIMISKNEAYGLVYLEAMSSGCITIAAKNEGFDGVIEHGVNGFLCNAGDLDELTSLIQEINLMSIEQKKLISRNAMATASKLTDENVALNYLNTISQ